jgi:hypothetical protein
MIHDCVKKDQLEHMRQDIEHLSHRVNGYEDDEGMYANVKSILKNQENNRSWIKGAVYSFSIFIITLFYFGVTDHNKIQDFPDNYISKLALNQVVMELKQQTAAMTRIVNSPNIDSLLVYRYELKEIQNSSSFDRMMKATRGSYAPVKIDTFDMNEALKRIYKKLKQ